MGRPKKTQQEKNAQGFIDIESYNEAAQLAERRGEIIVNQSRKIDGLLADIKGMTEKLTACQNNDQVIVNDINKIVTRMEHSFVMSMDDLGEITLDDVVYNMRLIKRIINKRYGRK